MSLMFETIYITVGSTKFDALIQQITSEETLKVFKKMGCKRLILQIGKGQQVDELSIEREHDIRVVQYDFKIEHKRLDIINADLVVGHAGAGTCLDLLRNRKPGILVVNDLLMNNHQQELAFHMKKEGFLQCCTVNELQQCLEDFNLNKCNVYEPGKNMDRFVDFMDDFMAI